MSRLKGGLPVQSGEEIEELLITRAGALGLAGLVSPPPLARVVTRTGDTGAAT